MIFSIGKGLITGTAGAPSAARGVAKAGSDKAQSATARREAGRAPYRLTTAMRAQPRKGHVIPVPFCFANRRAARSYFTWHRVAKK
jgi:hypothetical protein